MEAMKGFALQFWNHYLIMYRTNLIKAESKKRQALLTNGKEQSDRCGKGDLPCDQKPGECQDQERQRGTKADVVCSTTHNCDRAEMRRVFDLFDENKDERISPEELQQFMNRLGFELSDEKVKEMVGAVDQNRDDCVDFEEFFSLYSSLCAMGEDGHFPQRDGVVEDHGDDDGSLLRAFFVFDENKDGLISAPELQQVLLKLGLPEGRSLMGCQKMIERVDADGNGKVDFFEFKNMMSSDAFRLSVCQS